MISVTASPLSNLEIAAHALTVCHGDRVVEHSFVTGCQLVGDAAHQSEAVRRDEVGQRQHMNERNRGVLVLCELDSELDGVLRGRQTRLWRSGSASL